MNDSQHFPTSTQWPTSAASFNPLCVRLVKVCVAVAALLLTAGPTRADIRISEFVADNEDGLRTAAGNTADWIELFNHGTATVNLARIFHSLIKQRSGEGVQRLDNIEPNEHDPHRFQHHRL